MKKISIDSSRIQEVSVSLQTDAFLEKKIEKAKNVRGSQVILQSIDALLKEKGVALEDIDAITIHEGPGSYTGLRVGASIANTLAFCLQISLNGKNIGAFVYPTYE